MEGANTYEPGDWVDHKEGYYFVCGFCEKAGAGRQGKKFCSDKCRYRFNNQQRKLKSTQMHKTFRRQERNRDVLKNLSIIYGENTWIHVEILREHGFLENGAPLIQTKVNNEIWYTFIDYSMSYKNEKIKINKNELYRV